MKRTLVLVNRNSAYTNLTLLLLLQTSKSVSTTWGHSKFQMQKLKGNLFLKSTLLNSQSLFSCQQRTTDTPFYQYHKELLLALTCNALCCFRNQMKMLRESLGRGKRMEILILQIILATSVCYKNNLFTLM